MRETLIDFIESEKFDDVMLSAGISSLATLLLVFMICMFCACCCCCKNRGERDSQHDLLVQTNATGKYYHVSVQKIV